MQICLLSNDCIDVVKVSRETHHCFVPLPYHTVGSTPAAIKMPLAVSEAPWLTSQYSRDMTESSGEMELKKVCFGDISIREYPMVLGDHPSTRSGLPVTIDWYHQAEETMGLEMYLYMHKTTSQANSHSSGSKRVRAKRLGSTYRREYLLSLDHYTTEDFVRVIEDMQQVQESRMRNSGINDDALFKKLLAEGQAGSGKVLRFGVNFAYSGLSYTVNTAIDGGKTVADFGVKGVKTGTKAVATLGTFGVNGTKKVANLGVTGTKAVANLGVNSAKTGVAVVGKGAKGLVKVLSMPAVTMSRRRQSVVEHGAAKSASASKPTTAAAS